MKFLKCFLLITLAVTTIKAASEELDVPQEAQAQSSWAFLKDRLLQDSEIKEFADAVSEQLSMLDRFAASTPNAQQKLNQLLEVVQARRAIVSRMFFLQEKNYASCLLAKFELDFLYDKQANLDQKTHALLEKMDAWCEHQCELSFPPIENLLNKCSLAFDTLSECLNSIATLPAKTVSNAQAQLSRTGYNLPGQFYQDLTAQLSQEIELAKASGLHLSKKRILLNLRTLFFQEKLQFCPKQNSIDFTNGKQSIQTCVSHYCNDNLSSQDYSIVHPLLIEKVDSQLFSQIESCFHKAIPPIFSLVTQAKKEADELGKITFFGMKKYIFFVNELLCKLNNLRNKPTETAFTIELLPHIITTLSTEDKDGVISYLHYYLTYAFLLRTVDHIFTSREQYLKHPEAHENHTTALSQALQQKRAKLLNNIVNNRQEFDTFLEQELSSFLLRISDLTRQCKKLPENVRLIFGSFNRITNEDWNGGNFLPFSVDTFFNQTVQPYIRDNNIGDYLPQAVLGYTSGLTHLLTLFSDQQCTQSSKNNYGSYLNTLLLKFDRVIQKKQTSTRSETLGEKIVALADKMLPASKKPKNERKPKSSTRRGKPKSKKGQGKNKKKQQKNNRATSTSKNTESSKKAGTVMPSEELSVPVEARSTVSRAEKQKRVWKQLFGCFEPTIRIIDQTANTVIARCWRSFDSRDNVLILMRRSPDAQHIAGEDCTITVDPARLPKMIDTLDRGWDFFHTIPFELLEQFLPQLGSKHLATNGYLSELGFDVRENTYALTIEAKLLRGHMVNPKADEFESLWAKPYGYTGAFVWGVNDDDNSVCHRFFHLGCNPG